MKMMNMMLVAAVALVLSSFSSVAGSPPLLRGRHPKATAGITASLPSYSSSTTAQRVAQLPSIDITSHGGPYSIVSELEGDMYVSIQSPTRSGTQNGDRIVQQGTLVGVNVSSLQVSYSIPLGLVPLSEGISLTLARCGIVALAGSSSNGFLTVSPRGSILVNTTTAYGSQIFLDVVLDTVGYYHVNGSDTVAGIDLTTGMQVPSAPWMSKNPIFVSTARGNDDVDDQHVIYHTEVTGSNGKLVDTSLFSLVSGTVIATFKNFPQSPCYFYWGMSANHYYFYVNCDQEVLLGGAPLRRTLLGYPKDLQPAGGYLQASVNLTMPIHIHATTSYSVPAVNVDATEITFMGSSSTVGEGMKNFMYVASLATGSILRSVRLPPFAPAVIVVDGAAALWAQDQGLSTEAQNFTVYSYPGAHLLVNQSITGSPSAGYVVEHSLGRQLVLGQIGIVPNFADLTTITVRNLTTGESLFSVGIRQTSFYCAVAAHLRRFFVALEGQLEVFSY